jgi:signal transduction histidine kinase
MSTHRWPWARSLRWRLLAATLAALTLALVVAGVMLSGLFREHVMRQFEATLTQQLDQLTARLAFDTSGQPVIDPKALSDPRWLKPYSGLYWQLDRIAADGSARHAVLRSRSLWDASLPLRTDALSDGSVHAHEAKGPQGETLLMLERTVQAEGQANTPSEGGPRWRLIAAADLQSTVDAIGHFTGMLAASLLVLLGLLSLAAFAQVRVGLSPLHTLQTALSDVRQGHTPRLLGQFPQEVQPLVDDFNRVLDHNTEVSERARTQASNLAHALKTPLSVIAHAAQRDPHQQAGELPSLVQEQVATARRHIDWHLARGRMAATPHLPGQRTEVGPVVQGLLRVMARVHADRHLDLGARLPDTPLAFAGEAQDLQDMLGNLLDNACKWARTSVVLSAEPLPHTTPPMLMISVCDDGPGIAPTQREAVLDRGTRLDETVPGSGLGLAIVQDLARLYGGELTLSQAPTHPAATDDPDRSGLVARLRLPA